MSRRLPRSFFWVDQQLIRNGHWLKLGCQARLAYIAIVASCDRDGVSIWSRSKLMELAGCKDPEDWATQIIELNGQGLVELLPENVPPAVRVVALEGGPSDADRPVGVSRPKLSAGPIVIHTHTSIHLSGEKVSNVDPGNSD